MFACQSLTIIVSHIMDDPYKPKGQWKRCIGRIPLGIAVRGSWAKNRIFRVRRGNGYHGTVLGKKYQDRYAYFVPSSINNPEGQPARDAMAQANYNWFNVLTQDQRDEYNRMATHNLSMSGRNKFIGEYIKNNA